MCLHIDNIHSNAPKYRFQRRARAEQILCALQCIKAYVWLDSFETAAKFAGKNMPKTSFIPLQHAATRCNALALRRRGSSIYLLDKSCLSREKIWRRHPLVHCNTLASHRRGSSIYLLDRLWLMCVCVC